MARFRRTTIALLAVLVIVATARGAGAVGGTEHHVIGASEIQARIDQQVDKEDASRRAIQIMLQRPEVRRIAGQSGLDVERAGEAAAVLSGAELDYLAAQASEINAGFGGRNTVVISTTAIIIILLIIIILVSS